MCPQNSLLLLGTKLHIVLDKAKVRQPLVWDISPLHISATKIVVAAQATVSAPAWLGDYGFGAFAHIVRGGMGAAEKVQQ